MEYDAEEFDYIGWLEEELRELRVEEEVLECVRSMRCPGNCDDECSTSNYDGVRKSSSMQEDKDSTLDECVNDIHCPGNCEHVRKGSFPPVAVKYPGQAESV